MKMKEMDCPVCYNSLLVVYWEESGIMKCISCGADLEYSENALHILVKK